MSKQRFIPAFAACLFALIVGAKWAVFDHFGSPMPDWDQWDAEAAELFIPWFENDHFVEHLFNPHNEHRVVLTKLQNLTLGLLDGQWDARVEAASNALLHAALGVALWILGVAAVAARSGEHRVASSEHSDRGPPARSSLPATRYFGALLFLLTAILFGLPLAWQNVLGGFHSQQFWLLWTSFVAIALLPFARVGSARWWLGAVAALLALGSMGSGFVAAAVVLVALAWRLLRRETAWRETWPTLAFLLVPIAVGVITRVQPPWHESLKAATVHDFVFSIVHSLQWPLRDHDWAGFVLWLPWALLMWRIITMPRSPQSSTTPANCLALVIAALGGWVIVQLIATAYARGAGADYPASRYMDTLTFGAMINAIALGWLVCGSTSTRWRAFCAVSGLAWLATFGFGARKLADDVLRYELPDARKYYVGAESHVRRFLSTNNPKEFAYPDIPFPSADGLVERLGHPALRALMPVPVRATLPLRPSAGPSVFLENDAINCDVEHPPRAGMSLHTPPLDWTHTWGSFGEKGAAVTGEWRSSPIQARLHGWLKFETAGQLGERDAAVALELHDATTDALLATVRPAKVAGDSWRAAYVRTPVVPFTVIARDRDPQRWLAFSPPVEMGALSYLVAQMTKQGLLIVYLAAGAAIAIGLAALANARRS